MSGLTRECYFVTNTSINTLSFWFQVDTVSSCPLANLSIGIHCCWSFPLLRETVGGNHKAAPVMLVDFCFIGKKTDFGRARGRKTAAYGSPWDRPILDSQWPPKPAPPHPVSLRTCGFKSHLEYFGCFASGTTSSVLVLKRNTA